MDNAVLSALGLTKMCKRKFKTTFCYVEIEKFEFSNQVFKSEEEHEQYNIYCKKVFKEITILTRSKYEDQCQSVKI